MMFVHLWGVECSSGFCHFLSFLSAHAIYITTYFVMRCGFNDCNRRHTQKSQMHKQSMHEKMFSVERKRMKIVVTIDYRYITLTAHTHTLTRIQINRSRFDFLRLDYVQVRERKEDTIRMKRRLENVIKFRDRKRRLKKTTQCSLQIHSNGVSFFYFTPSTWRYYYVLFSSALSSSTSFFSISLVSNLLSKLRRNAFLWCENERQKRQQTRSLSILRNAP